MQYFDFRDAYTPEELAQLGWNPFSWVYDKAKDAVTWVGGKVYGTYKDYLKFQCGVIQSGIARNASDIAIATGNPKAAAAGGAVKLGSMICNWAFGTPGQKAPTMPPGSIQAADPAIGGYRVAIPVASMGALNGHFFNLGELDGVPTHIEVATSPTLVPGAQQVSLDAFKEAIGAKTWFGQWQNWALIGGAAVVLTGAYLLLSE